MSAAVYPPVKSGGSDAGSSRPGTSKWEKTKFVVVTGGVLSGVGKGVLASSTGVILKSRGVHITHIKIDPYINIDAGCMSPYEHGEVFVLDDGGEVDLDLGNYERFGDITLTSLHNITTGRIYQKVIENERRGAYLGRTVQVVPHVCDAVKEWLFEVAQIPCSHWDVAPQVCIVELGGTVGDIESMPFVEAIRQLQYELDDDDFTLIHVSLVPTVGSEPKTKPTQHSVKQLRALGLSPDVVVCRSENELSTAILEKIALFAQVKLPQTLSVYNVSNIYHVPVLLEEAGLTQYLVDKLGLECSPELAASYSLESWKLMAESIDRTVEPIKIALVGKYLDSATDTYHSMIKALHHAAYAACRKLELVLIEAPLLEETAREKMPPEHHAMWSQLCSVDGVVVAGGFGSRGTEGKIATARWCRENGVPFLGICLGFQLAVVEVARNVLGVKDAFSEEFLFEMEPNLSRTMDKAVIVNMPEVSTTELGGTMRLGSRATNIAPKDSLAYKLYQTAVVYERHRHRYEVNPEFIERLEGAGLVFSGRGDEGKRMEICELPSHPFFFGTQFHPEYKTRPLVPSPPFLGLLLAASGQLEEFLVNSTLPDPSAFKKRATKPPGVVPKWRTPPPPSRRTPSPAPMRDGAISP